MNTFLFIILTIKMIPAVVPLLVGAAIGIGRGIAKSAKAKKDARNNVRPTYNTPKYELENLAYLENMAGQGLTDTTKQVYQQNASRGLTASLDAILKSGGNVNNVDNVVQRYLDSSNAIALADEQARVRNIQNLLDQNRRMSGYEDKKYQVNKYAPFVDKAQDIARRKAEGEAQINSGINSVSAGLGSMFSNNNMQGAISNVFGSNTGGNTGGAGAGSNYIGISPNVVGNQLNNYPMFSYYGVDPTTMSASERNMFIKLVGNQ